MVWTPRSGELRHSVYIERRSDVDDGFGNSRAAYARLLPATGGVRASIKPKRGRETVEGQAVTGVHLYEIWIRRGSSQPEILTSDRVQDTRRPRTFNIRSVEYAGDRDEWWRITAESGVST